MKRSVLILVCFVGLTAFMQAQETDQRVIKATPAALPQSPKGDRIGSDLQRENLKGKVKSVATFNIDHDRRQTVKFIVSEDFYTEDGDLIRSVAYNDNSQPRGVGVYGYLDNMRVSRWGSVTDEKGEMPSGSTMQVPVGMSQEKAKADRRYDTRFTYKYDKSGRLVEEVHFSNAGELLTRTVHKYETPTRRLILEYAGGKEELARLFHILDDRGNVIELWMYDEDKKVQDIQVMKHQFDAQGNWIVEEVFVKETVNGKINLRPLATNYRTITYYP